MLKIGDKVNLNWCGSRGVVGGIINKQGSTRYKIYFGESGKLKANWYVLVNQSDVQAGLVEKVGDE